MAVSCWLLGHKPGRACAALSGVAAAAQIEARLPVGRGHRAWNAGIVRAAATPPPALPVGVRGPVRLAAGEHQRLLEADCLGVAPGRRNVALDLIEPPLVIEHRRRRMAAVLSHDAQLTAEHPVD